MVSYLFESSPLDVGDDVHHLAVVFEDELVGHLDRADVGHAAHVVAAEVEQHQVLGAFLGVGQEFLGQRAVLRRRGAAAAGSGDGADRHLAIAHAHEDFGARADHREAVEVEVIEEGRGVHAPQRAVEREGRQREFGLEALRQHHLEDVARRDVLLGLQHHRLVFLGRGVGARVADGRGVRGLQRQMVQRAVERVDDLADPLLRAHIGGARRHAVLGIDGGGDRHLVLHAVEDRHDGGADQHGVGQAQRVRVGLRQLLHQPHHVIAHVAEDARRHGWRILRQLDAALGEKGAQRLRAAAGPSPRRAPAGLVPALRLIGGLAALDLPDQVRVEADDRVAPAHGAALDRFQQEGIARIAGQLQLGGDGRFEVGDEPGRQDLRLAPAHRRGRSCRSRVR